MIDAEDNPNNPIIQSRGKVICPHSFLIKYTNENTRRHFANLINKLIIKHELKDFHVEEKKAYISNKISYNLHILTTKNEISFDELDRKFLENY